MLVQALKIAYTFVTIEHANGKSVLSSANLQSFDITPGAPL
jgi:hypothetical protein